MAEDFEIKDDPRKYWNNIPLEIGTIDKDVEAAAAPRKHTWDEREQEELRAEGDQNSSDD
jgi:hypothetical protein